VAGAGSPAGAEPGVPRQLLNPMRIGVGTDNDAVTDPNPPAAPNRTDPAEGTQPAERTERDVEYKGAPLDSAKGPGLGCFWIQIVLLVVTVVLAPLSAAWNWPVPIVITLFALVLVLLLFVGQTIIFLLRLVAADRRAAGRRRPMDSASKTVGEIEDEGGEASADEHPERGDA
jgi:hypothetical protein